MAFRALSTYDVRDAVIYDDTLYLPARSFPSSALSGLNIGALPLGESTTRTDSLSRATRRCAICLEDDRSASLCIPTPRCVHSRCICSTCRTIYLKSMVCAAGLTRVSCPQPGCGQVFKDEEVERWGDGETKSRHKYLAEIRGRVDPYASPQTQVTRPPPRDKRADERASHEYIQLNTKSCPKCAAPIVKTGDGCDHMKCAPPGGCGFEFCWLCLCDFQPIRQDGNHRHKEMCKHWRPLCG